LFSYKSIKPLFVIHVFLNCFITSSGDLPNPLFNEKIEALELNLKKLEDELTMEKSKLIGLKNTSIVDDQNNMIDVFDKITINTNDNKNNISIKKDLPNLVRFSK